MEHLVGHLQIQVNEKVFLKDPYSSDLGKKIVKHGITLIDEIGFENFTFRKLAKEIKTTESSVYRYFESKHKLLVYITSWYWGWMEYRLLFATANISSAEERLKTSIKLVTEDIPEKEVLGFIDLSSLNRIVTSESSKAYLTKEVDQANQEGYYSGYKRLITRISDIALEINPKFGYSHTLISTIVEGVHHQKYFADHLPSLTDIKNNPEKLASFYSDMALSCIKNKL